MKKPAFPFLILFLETVGFYFIFTKKTSRHIPDIDAINDLNFCKVDSNWRSDSVVENKKQTQL